MSDSLRETVLAMREDIRDNLEQIRTERSASIAELRQQLEDARAALSRANADRGEQAAIYRAALTQQIESLRRTLWSQLQQEERVRQMNSRQASAARRADLDRMRRDLRAQLQVDMEMLHNTVDAMRTERVTHIAALFQYDFDTESVLATQPESSADGEDERTEPSPKRSTKAARSKTSTKRASQKNSEEQGGAE